MRPALHGDAVAAARLLVQVLPQARRAEMARLLMQADAADAWRKRFGRAHPHWGNGTVMAVAQRTALPPEPSPPGDAEYYECLALVYAALAARRAEKARLSGRS